MSKPKRKLRKQFHVQCHLKNKISRNKFNQGSEIPIPIKQNLKNRDKINLKTPK